MNAKDLLSLGLEFIDPWEVVGHVLDLETNPSELRLDIEAVRGSLHHWPECGNACKAHDFKEASWWHINFFRYHCLSGPGSPCRPRV